MKWTYWKKPVIVALSIVGMLALEALRHRHFISEKQARSGMTILANFCILILISDHDDPARHL